MKFKAVIFDCDGVIVDTETINNQILKQKLAEHGLTLSALEMHQKFSGLTAEENRKTAEALIGKSLPDSFITELRAEFHRRINEHLEPIKDIPELISRINTPIAMATNAHRPAMDFKLNKIGLIDQFKQRFCIDDVPNPKPHPDLYLLAANALNTAPQDCLVIEDSTAGITAGVKAGMTVYGFCECSDQESQIQAGASKSFPTIRQLIEHLQTLNLLNPS
ncbi:HAD family phosphatase [Marinomonas agarivorans]|nr:HAD family phosphatase [Marinomonas agarivorans]